MNLKGCFHTERPNIKFCANCGSGLCYECYIEEEIGSRVTAFTSIDQEVRKDFGFFCPSCYIERINDSNYSKQYPNKPPNIINPFSWGGSPVERARAFVPPGIIAAGLLFYVALMGMGGDEYGFAELISALGTGAMVSIGLVCWLIFYYLSNRKFNAFIKKKQKALDLLNEHKRLGATQKRKEDEEPRSRVVYCKYCGAKNKSDQTSCKTCGASL